MAAFTLIVVPALFGRSRRRRRDDLELLNRASQLLGSDGDLDAVLAEVLDQVRDHLGAGAVELVTLGPEGNPVRTAAASPTPRNAATMIAPAIRTKGPAATLMATRPEGRLEPFGGDDQLLLQTLVNHLALSLDNRRLERSVVELDGLREQLHHKASHDPLTALPNAASFRGRLQQLVDEGHHGLAVVFVDLDDFKKVNDTFGHAAGDALLTIIGDRIGRCARAGDMAARLGGDEFALLLTDVDSAQAGHVATRVLAAVRDRIVIDGRRIGVQASVGVVLAEGVPADGRRVGADDLMRDADVAMYSAKRRGKGCFEFFEPDMTAALMLQDALEQDLDPAVRRGEFENHYQTVVDVHTGNVVAVETLVRWNHPWAGLIGPSEFIPLAEQTGAIVALGRHVLGNACRDASTWRYMNPDLCVSVNVSALQMTGDSLVEDVRRLLVESELPGEALIVEIREAMAMANLESIRGQLTQLRALGVRIALDGVDTSPGSLAGLDRLPVDMVKIPKKSLDLLEDDEVTIELLDSITDQGLQVVAEGIEEPEQRDVLMAAAGTLAQGYLFSRPVPAHFMTQMLVSDVSRGRAQRPAERTAPPAGSRGAAAAV